MSPELSTFTFQLFRLFGLPWAAAWLAALVGTWGSIRVARALDALDHPGHRSSHEIPTPRLGGLGVALGLFGVLFVLAFFHARGAALAPKSNPAFWRALSAGGLFALAFGLADDLRGLRPIVKLACQILCAAAAAYWGIRFTPMPLPVGAAPPFAWLGALAAALWIVFFMNAFNFMDGIDGQTATFGAMASLGLALPMLLGLDRDPGWEPRAACFILLPGALLGFLPFNVSRPARTFMGDGGAQMTGYVLALGLVSARPEYRAAAFLALWPFVYDAAYTLARRAVQRQNLFQAHRGHLYQRLLATGLTHRAVLLRTGAFHLVCLAVSFYCVVQSPFAGAAVARRLAALGLVFAATAAYTAHVWRRERKAKDEPGRL